ncbi:MAG TPA: hypothetical protein VGO49_15400 [Bradyrhizobium sp.]|jgi:hypothetical protein|nr:hypothetical protein [Bradyrhizobium sp.]
MPSHSDAYDAHQRERWLRHDAHLWIRHDVARWLPPGMDPADVFPALKRQRDMAENAAFTAKVAASRRVLAALRVEVDELKAALVRRRLEEAKYSPDQPRIPKRNPGGGRFTRIGEGTGQSPSANIAQPMGNVDVGDLTGSSDAGGLLDITPGDTSIDGVQLAGDLPDDPKTPLDDPAPKIPQERPDTREGRMGFVREAAEWVARNVVRRAPAVDAFFGSLDQVDKINALTDAIKSANDPAKTLEELQEPVGSESQGGYHDHHIVGQHVENRARFGDSLIDGRENLVRIPVLKHLDISAWYQTRNEDYGYLSPRDYLRDKDWDEQMRVGLDLLRDRKVLK